MNLKTPLHESENHTVSLHESENLTVSLAPDAGHGAGIFCFASLHDTFKLNREARSLKRGNRMSKSKRQYVCHSCGYTAVKWLGKCPGCGQWNTLIEEVSSASPPHVFPTQTSSRPVPMTKVALKQESRLDTGMEELNRVLGGGLVPGSLVLLGGDPGIGKSTLLLQLSQQVAQRGHLVLYVTGEESVLQTRLRAQRLGALSDRIYVLAETNMQQILREAEELQPALLVIDSIQTVYDPALTSAPGSVAQVRQSTGLLMQVAKSKGIPTFIVGHVTKQGDLAGPRLLEHMVDTVLYFEGERHYTYRILRGVKNRFGSTHEIGVFEMKEHGLVEVGNPSEMFLAERPQGVSGSVVVASLEGTRPVLVEVQALVAPTSFVTPKRMATGVDANRVALLIAVLEKRAGLFMQQSDAYVNVAGGIKINEPAIDLGIAIALASSFRDQPVSPHTVVIGEVGLTGEVRGVTRLEQRLYEAQKLGFRRVFVPAHGKRQLNIPENLDVQEVKTIHDAMEAVLGG